MRLRVENSVLKQKLRGYVDTLNNPAALVQMSDGGTQVRIHCRHPDLSEHVCKHRLQGSSTEYYKVFWKGLHIDCHVQLRT